MGVVGLILFAYDVVRPAETLLPALPDWAKTMRFAVTAVAGSDYPRLSAGANQERVRLMVRDMLKDRFHLQMHLETRREKVLKMSVDPGGLRLKEVPAPAPPEQEGRVVGAVGNAGGRLMGKNVSMAGVARAAGNFLRQNVSDDTALKGYYDFDFRWTAPDVPGAPPSTGPLGPEGLALFVSAMKSEAGLRFAGATGPVEYWIIDHIDQPSEN
jgi:uncharacterized protein (TIGR03435 family)